ncbi:arginase-1-like [Oscarella lobularis]|uniref:arginase-1-like n=1 Tax=Oscarella lobularis TaxID=121494 RepID=UPI0033138A66
MTLSSKVLLTRAIMAYLLRRVPTLLLRRRLFSHVSVVSVPFGKGQTKKGVERGPKVILEEGMLLEKLRELDFEVDHFEVEPSEEDRARTRSNAPGLMNASQVSATCYRLAETVAPIAENDRFSLVLGGDHSISVGSINGLVSVWNHLGVVWVDAHPDLNSPVGSMTGNAHGMSALSSLKVLESPQGFEWLKSKVLPNRLVYIGIREIDPGEWKMLEQTRVKLFSIKDVDRLGIGKIMEMTNDYLQPGEDSPVHLSFDIDAFDPLVAPCTGTKVPGGLSLREGLYIGESLSDTKGLVGMDVVEFNPELGEKADVKVTLDTINILVTATLRKDRTRLRFNY